ncbi:hypothetical protein L3X38_017682 [Prunus dulcis]|uniref:Aminotransferase-like plant mobile domain-containing protein n=1 Tax=Prunus dulcis TaxID=3755 RepID=A0AAD4W8B7_PRUDU|nr:hypothetical protein L3X38_017682 [Prunus dulcis]
MRTNNKCTEVGASHEGSRRPKTTVAKGTKAMHDTVKAKVKESGFLPFLSILGHGKKGDRPLLVALAERWWDTTHTFHFDEVGEMTMTPTDFAAITGLRVGGKRLTYDLDIYRNKNKVVKFFGKPIADLLAGERRVPYESLYTPYWRKNPKDDKETDQNCKGIYTVLDWLLIPQ